MKLVLETKPQGTVVDADYTVDLDASDAMSLVVPRTETRQEEVITGNEPIGITKTHTHTQKWGSVKAAKQRKLPQTNVGLHSSRCINVIPE